MSCTTAFIGGLTDQAIEGLLPRVTLLNSEPLGGASWRGLALPACAQVLAASVTHSFPTWRLSWEEISLTCVFFTGKLT